jgi:MFS family permease
VFGTQPDSLTITIRSCSLVYLIDGLCFGMLLPFFPFVVLSAGGAPWLVTQFVAAYAVAAFIGHLIAGRLSDQFGRIGLIQCSLLCSAIAYFGMAGWSTTLLLLFIFRVLVGLMTGRETIVQTLATERIAPQDHVRVIGAITSAAAAGAAFGPGLSSILSYYADPGLDHYELVFCLAAVLSLISLAVVHLSLRPAVSSLVAQPQEAEAEGRGEAISRFSVIILLNFLAALAFAPVVSVTALFAEASFGWSATEVGWVLVAVAIGIVVARSIVIPMCVKKFGNEAVLAACAILAGLALLYTGRADTAAGFSIALLAASVMVSGLNILAVAIVSRDCPLPHRGSVLGIVQAGYGGGLFLGAAVNGPLFEFLGKSVPFDVAATFMLIAFVLTIAGVFRGKNVVADQSQAL